MAIKQFIKENWFKLIVVILLASSFVLILIKDTKFPVDYIICNSDYTGCFVDAKFPNMVSCQRQVETGNWRCDETNPDNIKCKVEKSSMAVSYCKN